MRAQTGTDLGVRLGSDQGAVGGGDDRGEGGVADEVAVDSGSSAAALGDGPHDEALAAAHVTGPEHAGNARLEVGVAGDVGARVELQAEAFEQALGLRSEEDHSQEHELELDLLEAAPASLE